MNTTARARLWTEAALAVMCGLLALLTMAWPDWIEALTGEDLDGHDGSVEWLLVAAFVVGCAVLSWFARTEWRRLRLAAARS